MIIRESILRGEEPFKPGKLTVEMGVKLTESGNAYGQWQEVLRSSIATWVWDENHARKEAYNSFYSLGYYGSDE